MRLPPRRISLSDTDATGVAYAGRLADLALQRLEEALAAAGLRPQDAVGGPAGPAVVHLAVDYRRPARLGERLAATVTCAEIGTSSARFAVRLGTACTAEIVLVWVERRRGASAAWPPRIKALLGRLAR